MTLESIITFLSAHHSLTLVILFLGSYFETLIVSSFFIYGEFFFLAGAILAGIGLANLWYVVIVLYAGGILGDHSSYWIGRHWGKTIYTYLGTKLFFRKFLTVYNFERGSTFFKKYGGWSIFAGRFLGPVSWITPFLAGNFKMSYRRFTIFDFPAVILGIGQFIVVGYFLGRNYQPLLYVLQRYILISIFIIIIIVTTAYIYRRILLKTGMSIKKSILHYVLQLRRKNLNTYHQTFKFILMMTVFSLVLYIFILVIIFFVAQHKQQQSLYPDLNYSFNTTSKIVSKINSTTYYKSGTMDMGPINIILISSIPPDLLLKNTGWKKSHTFLRDNISLIDYIKTAKNGSLPISDLYFKEVAQDAAYEYKQSSTLLSREHIRIWNFGKYNEIPVYAINATKSTGFNFYLDKSFIVPLHGIDADIDKSRTFFINTFKTVNPSIKVEMLKSIFGAKSLSFDKDGETESLYYTDGKIAEIMVP